MTIKTAPSETKPSQANSPGKPAEAPRDPATRWTEARHAYPIYAALARQFGLGRLPHPEGELPPARPTREVFDRDLRWLDDLDARIKAFQLRQLLPDALNTSEENLRAFVHRQLAKAQKGPADRDKIDFLIVQYFALCAPERLYHDEIRISHVSKVLEPILRCGEPTLPEWCEPLEEILAEVGKCGSLRDLMERGLLEQGRLIKESAGASFYDPPALTALCRLNFLLRRSFILLLHADQKAVLDAISQLESQGVKAVDCRRAGFSAAEPIKRLRQFAESWRQPYQKDYSETSVSRAYEQLLALRADLEEALAPKSEAPADEATSVVAPELAFVQAEAGPEVIEHVGRKDSKIAETEAALSALPEEKFAKPPTQEKPLKQPPSKSAHEGKVKPKTNTSAEVTPTTQAEMEDCLEQIWEQLIDTPPSRGRSMSTVVLKDTKVLLSSWEVSAFVSEGGQDSDDLRRAVVARALLAVAVDALKRSGDAGPLESALALGRSEVSYFQGRVEQSKRAKNTEGAVNLGISTKRLLSTIEEAEALRP